MPTRLSPWAIAATALALTLGGCALPAPEDSPAPPSAEDTHSGAGADSAGSDGETDGSGSGDAGGASGACASAPSGNVDGGYPAENLPAVQERTAQLVEYFEAVKGRYCIDGGDITYFLVYDFAADGFHSLDVCGSVFTYFEGDFESATLVYTDEESPCG